MAVASASLPVAADLAQQVRMFLQRQAAVALWENGRVVARLEGERCGFALHPEGARLVCHFWSQDANLVRRVSAVGAASGGRLRLTAWRMGQSQPSLLILAPDVADAPAVERARDEFRLAVRAAVERCWRGWTPVPCAAARNGRSGLDRLVLRRQARTMVCVAVGEEESAAVAASALAHGLLLAAAAPKPVEAIRLVVPDAAVAVLAERRSGLRPSPPIELYRLDRSAGELELRDEDATGGNVATALQRPLARCASPEAAPPPEAAALLAEVRQHCPQAAWDPSGGGRVAVYGLDVARVTAASEALLSRFSFGCGGERTPLMDATRPDFVQLMSAVGRQRVPGGDRRDPYFAAQPERWLEHVLQRDPSRLDARLDPAFIHRQVAARDFERRDVLDLLALDREGRLVVIELKADEELDFPLQGLDYWRRARRHQAAGDFERLGYFPGRRLSPLPPRLWLVAPALRWHPRSEAIYAALAPEIAWTRIGINEDWRHGLEVVFRREGGG